MRRLVAYRETKKAPTVDDCGALVTSIQARASGGKPTGEKFSRSLVWVAVSLTPTDGIVAVGVQACGIGKSIAASRVHAWNFDFHELRRGNRAMVYLLTRKHRLRMRLPSQGHASTPKDVRKPQTFTLMVFESPCELRHLIAGTGVLARKLVCLFASRRLCKQATFRLRLASYRRLRSQAATDPRALPCLHYPELIRLSSRFA